MQQLPAIMRAVTAPKPGGPSALEIVRRPVPQPGLEEVLIKVAAAGLNRADMLQREGRYPPPRGETDILGLEVSGVIVAVGAEVTQRRVGERVCALLPGGGYADYALADALLALPVPDGIDVAAAAALPEAAFTVWANVVEAGGLRAGESLLVHGGASGIGVMAIQVGAALGAKVFATAGDSAKCAACLSLGAERAINYREEDFAAIVQDAGGVDVILDIVGGDYVGRNLLCLKPGGRLVQIAVQEGARANIDLLRIMTRRLTITGSTLRSRPPAEKARLAAAVEAGLWPMLRDGRLTPVVDRRVPLAEVVEAHRRMEASLHTGKILLVP